MIYFSPTCLLLSAGGCGGCQLSLKSKQFRLERPFCRPKPFLAFPLGFLPVGFFPQVDTCQWGGLVRAGADLMLSLLTEWTDSSFCMPLHTRQGSGMDISKLWLLFTQFLKHSGSAESSPCWRAKLPGTNGLQSPFASIHTQLVSLLLAEFHM